jgi:hypothetical protein
MESAKLCYRLIEQLRHTRAYHWQDAGSLGERGYWENVHEVRCSCRCRPHLLRRVWHCTSDSSAPDSTNARRLQFSLPHLETDEEHCRKVHFARLPAFCGVRHRARRNHSRPRDSPSLGLHRSGSPRRHFSGGIWYGHEESVGHQHKTCELPRLRLSDAASEATEINKAGPLGWLDMREVWLRDG